MIVGSLLLILVAVALLGVGLARGSNVLLIGSIAASLFAAVALVVGARQAAAGRVDEGDEFGERTGPLGDDDEFDQLEFDPDGVDMDYVRTATGLRPATGRARPTEPLSREPDLVGALATAPGPAPAGLAVGDREAVGVKRDDALWTSGPVRAGSGADSPVEDYDELDEVPPDEPAAQLISAADAARVARMSSDVEVIDGRPRYHLVGCVHLLGRESETLPVNEAVELGFTPCGLCEPDSALLAEARRV